LRHFPVLAQEYSHDHFVDERKLACRDVPRRAILFMISRPSQQRRCGSSVVPHFDVAARRRLDLRKLQSTELRARGHKISGLRLGAEYHAIAPIAAPSEPSRSLRRQPKVKTYVSFGGVADIVERLGPIASAASDPNRT